MVRGSRILMALGVAALMVGPAVVLGRDGSPSDGRYVPDPPAPTEVPREDHEPPTPPPAELRFSGLITFSDPSGRIMGHDPILWGESCHRLAVDAVRYNDVVLDLTSGTTEGRLEDLNLYAFDSAGDAIGAWDDATAGLGRHHEAQLPQGTAEIGVCLKGGLRGAYLMLVS